MIELLLSTDLDRTLLPNGQAPESPAARPLFARLAAHPALCLAFVTGRHLALLEDAIDGYGLPRPHFAICDVGTSIYEAGEQGWQLLTDWQEHLAADWQGLGRQQLVAAFDGLADLHLQEESKQGHFKLSYYAPAQLPPQTLWAQLKARIADLGIAARLVWSIDETKPVGLLDILPGTAGKLAAVEFLLQRLGLSMQQAIFAGDSGNDLEVLASHIPAVLVANASAEVREEALCKAREAGNSANLYLARGGYRGTNGNYAGGILEGVNHFFPQFDTWLEVAKS